MASKKGPVIYILIIILTPIILYYALTGDFLPLTRRYGMSLGALLISVVSGFVLAYLAYRIEEKFFSKNIKFEDIQQNKSKERYQVEKTSEKTKKSGKVFSSKNKCETCGTKMEYKEGMDSYYCPECHEYK